MAIVAKIHRYQSGNSTVIEVLLPVHTTITGNENHFHFAFDDANLMIAGMREIDKLLLNAEAEPVRYSITSIEMN